MESDGIEEGMEGVSRVAATAAARAAAELVREFERRAGERRDEALREAAQDRSREQALWDQTRAQLAPVTEDRWWEQATPQTIAHAYEQARAFDSRADARPFVERIETQVRERYGVDVDELRQQALTDAAEKSTEADKDRAEAARLVADADRAADRDDQVSEDANVKASIMYDSAERREDLASDLRDRGIDNETVEARVTADAGQAVPADEAARPADRSPKARKARGKGQKQRSREAQRG